MGGLKPWGRRPGVLPHGGRQGLGLGSGGLRCQPPRGKQRSAPFPHFSEPLGPGPELQVRATGQRGWDDSEPLGSEEAHAVPQAGRVAGWTLGVAKAGSGGGVSGVRG